MITIVAAIVGLSLCAVRPRGFVIRDDLKATRFYIAALIDCRVETHPALCRENVIAN
jgi:hypothetical protein